MPHGERVFFELATPVPTRHHVALLCSYDLLLKRSTECLNVSVPQQREKLIFTDWELTRAAFMARMASTLRHLGYLAPSFSRLDGAALCRTLVEHVVTFAWLSADPPGRLPRFLRDSYGKALRQDLDMGEHLGEDLLSPGLREAFEAYREETQGQLPSLPKRCLQADRTWQPRLAPLRRLARLRPRLVLHPRTTTAARQRCRRWPQRS